MSGARTIPKPPTRLCKQNSWSPDILREETWLRRKKNFSMQRRRRCKSVSEDDFDELKACIELGFGFDSPEIDPKLADTFPALELYYAVNKQYSKSLSRCSSAPLMSSDSDQGSFDNIIDSGEDPETVKTRLKQWAQVVACSAIDQASKWRINGREKKNVVGSSYLHNRIYSPSS